MVPTPVRRGTSQSWLRENQLPLDPSSAFSGRAAGMPLTPGAGGCMAPWLPGGMAAPVASAKAPPGVSGCGPTNRSRPSSGACRRGEAPPSEEDATEETPPGGGATFSGGGGMLEPIGFPIGSTSGMEGGTPARSRLSRASNSGLYELRSGGVSLSPRNPGGN